jgi:hypothetical protein
MLRTNLSTRPFYNERVVHLLLALAAVVVLAITVLNIVQLLQLSRQNTSLSARIREDRTAADDYARKARQTRQGINKDELNVIVTAAREANALIDNRTFSWTALFNHIESMLPPDVMLASIRPTIDENGTRITMIVVARRTADIDEFIEKLESTGAFEKLLPKQQGPNEDNLIEATIETLYVPAAAQPPSASAPSATGASR